MRNQDIGFSLAFAADPNPSGRLSWVILNPASGTIPKNGSVPVSIAYDSTASLPAGTYTGKLSVLTPGAAPAQKDIPVRLVVSATPALMVMTLLTP